MVEKYSILDARCFRYGRDDAVAVQGQESVLFGGLKPTLRNSKPSPSSSHSPLSRGQVFRDSLEAVTHRDGGNSFRTGGHSSLDSLVVLIVLSMFAGNDIGRQC